MAALFFAVLWRPRSWPGMLAAGLVACYASSSEIIAFVYAPLLLIRLLALPRIREHAVTAGWLLGLALQVPVVVLSYVQHTQRLGTLATPGQALAFYCHNVILRALGWHLSVWLQSAAGYNGATVIVGAILALALGWAIVTGDRLVRLFIVVALLAGFAQTVFDATISQYVIFQTPTPDFMPAARYSTIPVVLIAASGIVAVDSYIRRRGPRPLVAACVLACVLGFGWVTDFRYATQRAHAGHWLPYAQGLVTACTQHPAGDVTVKAWGGHYYAVPCPRIRR
jgi:hypothetical protein